MNEPKLGLGFKQISCYQMKEKQKTSLHEIEAVHCLTRLLSFSISSLSRQLRYRVNYFELFMHVGLVVPLNKTGREKEARNKN